MDTIASLSAVLNTLNGIEVKGKENLDKLLGCIQTVESVIMTMNAAESKKEEANG